MNILHEIRPFVQPVVKALEPEIKKVALTALRKIVDVVAKKVLQALSSPREGRKIHGHAKVLKDKDVHMAHHAGTSRQEKCARTCDTLGRTLNRLSEKICIAFDRMLKGIKRLVSECLDDLIPARKKARALRGRVTSLKDDLEHSRELADGFAQSAEAQKERAEKAEAERKKAEERVEELLKTIDDLKKQKANEAESDKKSTEELLEHFSKALEERTKRADRAEEEKKEAEMKAEQSSKSAEEQTKRAEAGETKISQLEKIIDSLRIRTEVAEDKKSDAEQRAKQAEDQNRKISDIAEARRRIIEKAEDQARIAEERALKAALEAKQAEQRAKEVEDQNKKLADLAEIRREGIKKAEDQRKAAEERAQKAAQSAEAHVSQKDQGISSIGQELMKRLEEQLRTRQDPKDQAETIPDDEVGCEGDGDEAAEETAKVSKRRRTNLSNNLPTPPRKVCEQGLIKRRRRHS